MTKFEVAQIIITAIKTNRTVWFPGSQGHIKPTKFIIPKGDYDAEPQLWRALLDRQDTRFFDVAETTVFAIAGVDGDMTYLDPSRLPFIQTAK